MELAERKLGESTIYAQALGEPLGGNAPFSMVSLLHQAGRLPLVAPQKLVGWALANSMELAFKWLKESGKKKHAISYQGQTVELSSDEIPDDIQFQVRLDISMPGDKLDQVGAAVQALTTKLASKRYVRENILDIDASDEMDEEIWSEDAATEMAMLFMQFLQSQQGQTPPPEVGGGGSRPPGNVTPPEGEAPAGFHKMPDGSMMPDSEMEGSGQGGLTGNEQGGLRGRVPMRRPVEPLTGRQ